MTIPPRPRPGPTGRALGLVACRPFAPTPPAARRQNAVALRQRKAGIHFRYALPLWKSPQPFFRAEIGGSVRPQAPSGSRSDNYLAVKVAWSLVRPAPKGLRAARHRTTAKNSRVRRVRSVFRSVLLFAFLLPQGIQKAF